MTTVTVAGHGVAIITVGSKRYTIDTIPAPQRREPCRCGSDGFYLPASECDSCDSYRQELEEWEVAATLCALGIFSEGGGERL